MQRRNIILGVILLAAGFSAHAGVIVFNNGTVLVTTKQVERAGEIIVGLPSGDAIYTPDKVVWLSKDATMSSLWQAAQAAAQEGKADVALVLAREAALKEPANAAAAKQMVAAAESKAEAAQPPPVAQGGATTGGFAPAPGAAHAASPGAAATAPVPVPAGAEPAEASAPAPEMVVTGAHGWPVEESAISAEDLRVNAIVIGVFGLIVLFTLWKMTVSEA